MSIDQNQNNLEGIAYDLGTLGDIAYWKWDYHLARKHWTESLALYRQRQDINSIAVCLQNLGEVSRFLGEYHQAIAPTEEAIRMFREMSNQQFPGNGSHQFSQYTDGDERDKYCYSIILRGS